VKRLTVCAVLLMLSCLVLSLTGCSSKPADVKESTWQLSGVEAGETKIPEGVFDDSLQVAFLEDGAVRLTFSGQETGGTYQQNEDKLTIQFDNGATWNATVSGEKFSVDVGNNTVMIFAKK